MSCYWTWIELDLWSLSMNIWNLEQELYYFGFKLYHFPRWTISFYNSAQVIICHYPTEFQVLDNTWNPNVGQICDFMRNVELFARSLLGHVCSFLYEIFIINTKAVIYPNNYINDWWPNPTYDLEQEFKISVFYL